MSKINFFKSLTYNPRIRRLIRICGFERVARRLYWTWVRPENDTLTLELEGILGKFYVHTPNELRLLEGLFFREKQSLEKLISFLQPGDTIYDIGAQVGLYTVLLAKTVKKRQGQVIAFEPEKENFKRLQENVRLNGLNNVRLFQKALGEKSEKSKLYVGENGEWCSLVEPLENREKMIPQIVEIVRGDDFLKNENLPPPQIVKIDVDGWEYFVLKGLSEMISSPECRLILVELHPTMLPSGIKMDSITELLKRAGFISFNSYPCGGEYHLLAGKKSLTPLKIGARAFM